MFASAQEANPIDWRSVPKVDNQITMKIGHSVNMEWSSHTATLKRFAELVAIYTNNEIRAEIFPGAQLGGELEMMQQARQGALQVTFPATNNAAALAPSLNVFILPYLPIRTTQQTEMETRERPDSLPFDTDWNSLVRLWIRPRLELSDAQARAVRLEYGFDDKTHLLIETRKALVFYVLRRWRLNQEKARLELEMTEQMDT